MEHKQLWKVLIYAVPSLAVTGLIFWFSCFHKAAEAEKDIVPEGEAEQKVLQPEPELPPLPPLAGSKDDRQEEPRRGQESTRNPVPELPPDPLEEAAGLSQEPLWKLFLCPSGLKNIMLFLDEIGLGLLPQKSLGAYRSEEAFSATKVEGEWRLSEACAARYTPLVDIFCSVDAGKAGRLYNALAPKFEAALRELGYTGRKPDEITAQAIAILRSTPQPEQDPPLVRIGENLYQWKERELEELLPVQKFALRLGVRNLSRIRKQAEAMAAAAGFEKP